MIRTNNTRTFVNSAGRTMSSWIRPHAAGFAMQQQHTPHYLLRETERYRSSPGRYAVLWQNGLLWRERYDEMVQYEKAESHQLRQRVEGSNRAREEVEYSEWLDWLVGWYQETIAHLEQTRTEWEASTQRPNAAQKQQIRLLDEHIGMLRWRMFVYKHRMALFDIEMIERQRMRGTATETSWDGAWHEAHQVYDQWLAHAHSKGSEHAQIVRERHQNKLDDIARLQQHTIEQWQRGPKQQGLSTLQHDHRRVCNAIRELNGEFVWTPKKIMIGVAIVVFVLFMLFASRADAAPSPTGAYATSTSAAISGQASAATARPIGGRASPATATAAPITGRGIPATPTPTPTFDALFERAKGYLARGNCADALEVLQQAYTVAADSNQRYLALDAMGFCYYELRNKTLAMSTWQRALREQWRPEARAALAVAQFSLGNTEDGLAQYQDVLQTAPEYANANHLRNVLLWGPTMMKDAELLLAKLP